MSEIIDFFDQQMEDHAPEDALDDNEALENQYVILSSLGYLSEPQNVGNTILFSSLQKAIHHIRSDQQLSQLSSSTHHSNTSELSLEEITFFEQLLSLDGDFPLHHYAFESIMSDPLLKRVLLFRLKITKLITAPTDNVDDRVINKAFDTLKVWLGADTNLALELCGDISALLKKLAMSALLLEQGKGAVLAFINPSDDAIEKRFRSDKSDFLPSLETHHEEDIYIFWKRLIAKLKPISRAHPGRPQGSRNKARNQGKYRAPESVRATILQHIENPLKGFLIHLFQLNLWHEGYYDGKLDSQLGPLSLDAIMNACEMLNEGEKFNIQKYLFQPSNDLWLLNLPAFIHDFMESEPQPNGHNDSISAQLHQLSEKVPEQDRNTFFKAIDNQIKTDAADTQKKRHTQKSKHFFSKLKRFFKQVGNAVYRGIHWVVSQIMKLFNWVKNGVKKLIREIKEAFRKLTSSIAFIFGNRTIESDGIKTVYDGDFDAITLLKNAPPQSVVNIHLQKSKQLITDIQYTVTWLKVAIPLVINLMSGPYGWLQAGIMLVKTLGSQHMSGAQAIT